jgi:hypothetical protein
MLVPLICIWRGYKRGLFRSVVVSGATILTIVLSNFATPYVSRMIQEYTNIDEKIEAYIASSLEIDEMQESASKYEEMMQIDNLSIPDALKMAVINNNNDATYNQMNITGFYAYIVHYLSYVAINCLSFLTVQVILSVALFFILRVTQMLTEIPILHGIDKVGGCTLGMVQALAILWCVFIFISLIGSTPLGIKANEQISSSILLNFLYEHNWLMNTVTNITNIIVG